MTSTEHPTYDSRDRPLWMIRQHWKNKWEGSIAPNVSWLRHSFPLPRVANKMLGDHENVQSCATSVSVIQKKGYIKYRAEWKKGIIFFFPSECGSTMGENGVMDRLSNVIGQISLIGFSGTYTSTYVSTDRPRLGGIDYYAGFFSVPNKDIL